MKKNILFLILVALGKLSFAQFPEGLDKNWQLDEAKSDEFNANKIDSIKWGHQLWFDCSSEVAFKEENVSVNNGYLAIQVKDEKIYKFPNLTGCSKIQYDKTSGAIISNFEIPSNSYLEIRAKLVDYRADVTSAIWLSDEPDKDKNPNIEIDMVETLSSRYSKKTFTSAMHIWYRDDNNKGSGHLKLDGKKTRLKNKVSDEFHIFGLERKGDFIRMYIDGEIYWQRNMLDFPQFLDQPRKLIINIEGHNGRPKKGNYTKEILVDYVRIYNYSK